MSVIQEPHICNLLQDPGRPVLSNVPGIFMTLFSAHGGLSVHVTSDDWQLKDKF